MPDARQIVGQIGPGRAFHHGADQIGIAGVVLPRAASRRFDAARADVFDYIERFYNTIRRHSTIGYLSPAEFERKVGLA